MDFIVISDTIESNANTQPDKGPFAKPLTWYLSLAGDSAVTSGSLPASDSTLIQPYRYDWLVGLSCCADPRLWWDWQASLREEDTLKVQILIECPKGVTWSELSIHLLALHPSRNTTSWFEENADASVRAVGSLVKTAGSVLPGLALGAELLNAIPSEGGRKSWFLPRKKQWFLYRYYDVASGCPAIEWTISKNTLREYGPLLRGSMVLAFHGEPTKQDAFASLRLQAGLGLRKRGDLVYLRPQGPAAIPRLTIRLATLTKKISDR
jgi:hypothetical protein